MENLYVIEGTSNSGKSTTSQFLRVYSNVVVIPEFSDFSEAPKPSKTLEEEIQNQKIFFEIEKKRMELVKENLHSGKIVFLERNFISILAVSYSFKKLGKYNAFDNANELHQKMKESTWFLEPSSYFFLSASYKEIINRNLTRGKELKKVWLMESFNYYQKQFYDIMGTEMKNSCMIDTTNKKSDYASEVIAKKTYLRR